MTSINILVVKTMEADYTQMFVRLSLYVHGRATVF